MNIYITVLLLFLLALGWSFNPFCMKKAMGTLTSYEYLFLNSVLVTSLIIIFYICRCVSNNINIFPSNKLDKIQGCWLLLGGLITVITSLLLIILIKEHRVSHIIPQIQPMVIILTLIIGYVFFRETLSKLQLFGIFLIIIGLTFINYNRQVDVVMK